MLADLRTMLLADGTVSGLVGTAIYPIKRPQSGGLPCIILNEIDEQRPGVLNPAEVTPGVKFARVQMDTYATTYLAAKALSDACLAVVEAVVRNTTGSTFFFGIIADGGSTSVDPGPDEGSQTDRVRVDLIVSYKEA